jgi:hypothetical protein
VAIYAGVFEIQVWAVCSLLRFYECALRAPEDRNSRYRCVHTLNQQLACDGLGHPSAPRGVRASGRSPPGNGLVYLTHRTHEIRTQPEFRPQ